MGIFSKNQFPPLYFQNLFFKQKKRAKKEENLCREHGFMQQTIRIKMWITFYFCGKEHLFVDKYPHFLWFSFAKASKLSTIYQKLPSYPQENKKYPHSKSVRKQF